MESDNKYWILANVAAKKIRWFPETIYTQWVWETGHFTSYNFLANNNIAGQTWYEGCGHLRGTPRPSSEGGFYIKYNDPVQGYVDFIQKNHRYDNIKNGKTVEEQIDLIAKAGWAVDPRYAIGLKSLHQSNIRKGIYKLPIEELQPKYPGHLIKEGSRGENVKMLQKKVCTKVDGIFGPKTKAAVKTYQKKHGLTVDGIVGPKTWDKMF
jgi:peptidoglycan hydrolase-like protein with peptidoglycan-binding domain